jgi:hypothetical protein
MSLRLDRIALPLLALALLASTPAGAQQDGSLVSRWELNIGSIFTNVDTDVRADASRSDLGTEFDLEDTLAFGDRTCRSSGPRERR